MFSREDFAYMLLALLLWIPMVLAVYPPQQRGQYVYFGIQFTRAEAVSSFFVLVLLGLMGFASYRTWQYLTSIGDVSPSVVKTEERD